VSQEPVYQEDVFLIAGLDLLARRVPLVGGAATLLLMLGREQEQQLALLDVAETRRLLAWLKEQFPEDA
jgi:hypothetical protein